MRAHSIAAAGACSGLRGGSEWLRRERRLDRNISADDRCPAAQRSRSALDGSLTVSQYSLTVSNKKATTAKSPRPRCKYTQTARSLLTSARHLTSSSLSLSSLCHPIVTPLSLPIFVVFLRRRLGYTATPSPAPRWISRRNMDSFSLDCDENDEQPRQQTCASPFLQFLENTRLVFDTHVLPELNVTDRGLFSRVSSECRDATIAFGMPHAGASRELPFQVQDFVESVELLKWGESNGCPVLDTRTFALAAGSRSGILDVIMYLHKHRCPW